jgi:hypothetical protein
MSGSIFIFPTSPLPADISRTPVWGESVQKFDSGAEQGATPWQKPLIQYSINLSNIPRSKQSSIMAFYNLVRGRTNPWLIRDPYDFLVNGAVCVASGTGVRSFFVRTIEGFPVIPASGTLRITSALSGTLTHNTHYSFNMVTGVFSTHLAVATGDTWTASCQYFRKCRFDSYQESSRLWEQFNGTLSFHEIALP